MTINIQPTDATLGAFITGVELETLDDVTWQAVDNAFNEHALLIFPGQKLSPAGQLAFARRFGDIEEMEKNQPTIVLSNRSEDGKKLPEQSEQVLYTRGNEGWHTDSSYMPLSAKASVISAHIVPSSGGGTEWADARAAYDALDDSMKERIARLSAYHSYAYSQGKLGHTVAAGRAYGFFEGESPLYPLVKIHSATGRPALYLGRHACRIPGLEDAEAETLLSELMAFTCQAPRIYSHQWQVGDVIVWDNRCLLHRAQPYDDAEPRLLMHTRIKGDRHSETAENYR